jgi:NTP pyrophosphatase (non-canonical NTP hydrolase)
MDERYRSKNLNQAIGHMVEECGEVLAAVGKSQRWGLESSNPELPESERETNRTWLLREMRDLKAAIKTAEDWLIASMPDSSRGADDEG